MTLTYHLNEAKISMKARKQKQSKKKNYEIASFKKLLRCVSFYFLFHAV